MSLCINPQCQNPHNSDTQIFCKSCGSELLLDGKYRVIRELGQGGFGTTYEVLDLYSQPRVLKVLMDNHPKYVELFQQEAEVLSILNQQGIPKIDLDGYFAYYPRDKEEPLHCLVMEKIEGLNLEEYIQQRGNRPIQPKRALRWLAELALILEQVHEHDFFHRDIKPANIMLRANGCLALIDFGTVRQVTSSYIAKQEAGAITGVVSTGYTPIEQMRGKAVRQSDFYALGGTMIFLLTAQNPSDFYDFDAGKLKLPPTIPNFSPQFADLIERMMAFSPSQRPQTARDILNRVIAIDSSLQGIEEYLNPNLLPPRPTQAPPATTSVKNKNITSKNITSKNITSKNITSAQATIFSPQLNIQVSPEFIQRCREELSEFIGPIATIICNRAVSENPNISKLELLQVLAQKIPNSKQAQEFQQRLL